MTGCPTDKGPVRLPAVAGAFYPRDPQQLGQMIDAMLAEAKPPAIKGRIRALVVPHAGYVYSGPVAAYGFKAIAGSTYKTVVLIGNSHREAYNGASVYAKGTFKTPLGDVEIDADFAGKLMAADPRIFERESAHLQEHSLEVEVPFLQKTIGTFKLVPILLGTESTDAARLLGEALARLADEDTLLISSTDMSHYPPYDQARFADTKTAEAICSGSVETLERTLRQLERMGVPKAATFLCGEGSVKAVMFAAEKMGARNAQLLKYANSGDTAGSKDGVVGYCAIAFSGGGGGPAPAAKAEAPAEDEVLNKEEQEAALKLARLTVETFVRTGSKPEWKDTLPGLAQPLGAFVTLKKHGELRGCIGRFQPDIPLWQVIQEMAIAAATQDHRFQPVSQKELSELEYEISVLSPLRRIKSWKEIQLGRHGVQVVRGFRHGVYLPQVATDTGWDLETFMGTLCAHKAGLPQDAWKDPATELYVFTAQVFGDKSE